MILSRTLFHNIVTIDYNYDFYENYLTKTILRFINRKKELVFFASIYIFLIFNIPTNKNVL